MRWVGGWVWARLGECSRVDGLGRIVEVIGVGWGRGRAGQHLYEI